MRTKLKFSLYTILFALFITGLNLLVEQVIFPGRTFYLKTNDHIFIAAVTWLTLYICGVLIEMFPKVVGYTYLSLGVVKLIGVSSYLMPELLNKDETTKSLVLHFFALYFLYQFFEVILLGKFLNNMSFESKQESKNKSTKKVHA